MLFLYISSMVKLTFHCKSMTEDNYIFNVFHQLSIRARKGRHCTTYTPRYRFSHLISQISIPGSLYNNPISRFSHANFYLRKFNICFEHPWKPETFNPDLGLLSQIHKLLNQDLELSNWHIGLLSGNIGLLF